MLVKIHNQAAPLCLCHRAQTAAGMCHGIGDMDLGHEGVFQAVKAGRRGVPKGGRAGATPGASEQSLGVWQAGSEHFLAGDFGEVAQSLSVTWLQQ